MNCISCARSLGAAKARAAISILVAGDEYIYSYYSCEACGSYTVEAFHDRFMGESDTHFLPPIAREEGDRAVALIDACPSPGDKFCDCPSHLALYTGRVGP